jgi:hypothetical protein
MLNLGTVRPGSTIYIPFDSFAGATGASITITGLAVGDILIYKNGGTTQRASTTGFTLLDTDGIDFDGITGIHGFSIDLSSNATADFYTAGASYFIVISTITVDSQTVSFVAAHFRIGYPDAILDTTIATLSTQTSFTLTDGPAEDDALNGCTVIIHDIASAVQLGKAIVSDYTGSTKTVTLIAGVTFTAAAGDNISVFVPTLQPTAWGRTLDISATGEAGLDWANIGSPTTAQNLSATNIDTDQVVASVSGAVGSVTGAVGSVTGSIGSVAAGGITATSIATGAIDADALATDAVDEIVDAVWNEDATGHQAQGSFGQVLGDSGADADSIWALANTNLDATVSSRSTITTAQVNTEVDTALADINLDHLVGTATGIPAIPAGTYIDQMMDDGVATYDRTTDSLQAIRDRGDAAWITATGFSTLTQADVRTAVGLASANLDTQLSGIQSDTDNIQTRLPAALVGGKMDSDATAISGDTVAADNAEAFFDGTGYAGTNNVIPTVTTTTNLTTNNDKTGYALSAAGVDAILDDAITEPAGVFAWGTATLRNIISWLGALSSNEIRQTAALQTLRNRADSVTIATAAVADDGTTATKDSFT